MKTFTGVILILLTVGYIYTGACTTATDNSFIAKQADAAYGGLALTQPDETLAVGTAEACLVATQKVCCDPAKLRDVSKNIVGMYKTAITDFYGTLVAVGAANTKLITIASTVTEANLTAAIAENTGKYVTGLTDKTLGVTLFKYISKYADDFTAFKTGSPTCFATMSATANKALCYGCNNANAGKFTSAMLTFPVSAAVCATIVKDCISTWTFMHRVSWIMQIASALNKIKGGAAVTLADAPATLTYQNAMTLADVDAAINACPGFDGTSTPAGCVATTHQKTLCQAFGNVFGTIPRSDKTLLVAGSVNQFSRRVLAGEKNTGAMMVVADASGMHTDAAQTVVPTTGVATFVAADVSAWTAGVVAANTTANNTSNTSNTSTSTTSKNAKVLIGTLLTAILSIALLN